MISRIRPFATAAALTALVAVAGAGSAVQAQQSRASMASIAITSTVGTVSSPLLPSHGAFTLKVAPSHFMFDPAHIGSKTNMKGSGHFHVYIDSFNPASPFTNYLTAGAADSVMVPVSALTKLGVTSGTHTLYVVLANNDHSLVKPIAAASTVIELGPSARITDMTDPSMPLSIPAMGSVTLHVNVAGFKLAPSQIGKTAVPGEGHYHVYVDSFNPRSPFTNYVTAGAASTVQVTAAELSKLGVKPGLHTLYVVLANNDHSLVTPISGDQITVNVAG